MNQDGENAHIMKTGLLPLGKIFELSSEHPNLEAVQDFCHPSGMMESSGFLEIETRKIPSKADNH